MSTGKYIVGIGEALWDMFPTGKEIGGASANFAYHVSQFGLNSKVVSAVGDDCLGAELLGCFDKIGLQYDVQKTTYPTGTVEVALDLNGVPVYEIKENVAWDNIPFNEQLEELAKNTSVVCFGSLAQRSNISKETIRRFLLSMPAEENVYKVFDINLRQNFYTKDVIIESLNQCNVLKINDEELILVSELFGYSNTGFENVCKQLLAEFRLQILILTCGADSSYVFSGDDVSHIRTPRVEVADTVGAGDSFTAAFISSILQGKNIGEAHSCAVEVSAYVCSQKGAMPTLPKGLF